MSNVSNPRNVWDHKRTALMPVNRPSSEKSPAVFDEAKYLKEAFRVRLNSGDFYPLSREMVYCFFDIPAVEAARIMRVSVSLLKRIRAWVRVERWPCFLVHSGEFDGLTRIQIVEGRNEVISAFEKEYESLDEATGSGSRRENKEGNKKMRKSKEDVAGSGSQVEKKKKKSGREVIDRRKELGLALEILKAARDYAALYLCLVGPDAGRRQSIKTSVGGTSVDETSVGAMTMEENVALYNQLVGPPVERRHPTNTGAGETNNTSNMSETTMQETPGEPEKMDTSAELPRRVKEIVDQMKPSRRGKRKARVSVRTVVEPEDCFWPVSVTQDFDFDGLFARDDAEDDELMLGPVTFSANVSTTVVVERGYSAGLGSDEDDMGILGE